MKIFKVQSPKKSILISLSLTEATMIEAMLRLPANQRWVDGNVLSKLIAMSLTEFQVGADTSVILTLEEQIILYLSSSVALTADQLQLLLRSDFDAVAFAIQSLQDTGIVSVNENADGEPGYSLTDSFFAMTVLDEAAARKPAIRQIEDRILDVIKKHPDQNLTSLSNQIGLQTTTVRPILISLWERGVIESDGNKYPKYSLPRR